MSAPSLAVPQAGRFARRLSSIEATTDAVQMGPTVVVPPKHLMAPSGASEVATGFGEARQRLDSHVSTDSGASSPTVAVRPKPSAAFN